MTRVVKVGLDVDEAPFVRGMGRAERAAEKLDGALDDVTGSASASAAAAERASDSAQDLGASAKDAGGELSQLRRDAERLDRQIDETSDTIRDLARAIAAASDAAERADLDKKLNVQRRTLRQQTSLRKLIDVDSASDMGAELASEVGLSFAARLGPVIARAPLNLGAGGGAVAAIAAPLAAGLTTVVGAAVGGAIIGGVGAGGIVGGITLAAKDPAVKAAGAALGTDLSEMFGRSASAFVPSTLSAIDKVDDRVSALEPSFNRAFTSAAKLVDPLVDGLLAAGENALPGVIDALEEAGPAVEAVAEGVRDFGSTVGEGLSELSEYADEGARALQLLFAVMEFGVDAAFELVEGMMRLYGVAELVGAVMTGDIKRVFELATAEERASETTGDLTGVVGELGNKLRGLGEDTKSGADAAMELKTAFDALFNQEMGYDRALIAYKDGVKELNKELREGKRTLDVNTQAGRDNAGAVLDQIGKIKDLRDARLEQGESIDVVNGKYQKEIAAIRTKLEKMGYEKSEIDALIGKYQRIPGRVSTTVSAETQQAERNLAAVRNLIAQIKSKRVVITTDYYGRQTTRSEGRNVGISDGIGGRRWGGITEHAQWGTLREAQIAAPVSPARYAWAEPATGGEAFIPRYGDRDRSLDILGRAAAWYGVGITARGASRHAGMGMTTVVNQYSLSVAPGVVGSQFELEQWLVGALDSLKRQGRT